MKGSKRMSSNATNTSVADAVPAPDSTAKRLTGDERRREILDAVRTVSSELGVSHLSVSAVTKRAGCTRSLFYHYFADMDAAVTAVMDEAIDGFYRRARAVERQPHGWRHRRRTRHHRPAL